jgi:hypothetical protein
VALCYTLMAKNVNDADVASSKQNRRRLMQAMAGIGSNCERGLFKSIHVVLSAISVVSQQQQLKCITLSQSLKHLG